LTLQLSNYRDMYATKFGLPLSARYEHAEDVVEHFTKEVMHQHRDFSLEEARGRALARLDCKEYRKQKIQPAAEVAKPIIETQVDYTELLTRFGRRVLWLLGVIIALLVILILLSHRSHAQVDGVKLQKDGVTVGGPCMGGICGVNFSGSGCAVTKLAQVWTVTCTAGTVTNNPAGTVNQIQTNDGAGAFSAIPSAGLGKVLIDQGAGNAPAFADPLVQGLTAHDAVGTSTNPVAVGGFASAAAPSDVSADGDIVRAWLLRNGAQASVLTAAGALIGGDAANGLDVDVTRLPSLPAGSNVIGHIITDTGSTTAVTGNVASTSADGANVTLGAKADAKSAATDTTSITVMQVLKEISFLLQNTLVVNGSGVTQPVSGPLTDTQLRASAVPVSLASVPSHAVTNAGTFAVQEADGANTVLGSKADAKSTATDTTSITIMQVLKEISAMVQAPPSQAVTNAGTFATQATLGAGSNIVGKFGIDQTTPGTTNAVQAIAGTTGGATPSFLAAAATTNATNVKASAGTVYHISVSNVNATVYYLRMYNLATAPTCSSATGFVETIPIPAATTGGGREIDVTVGQAYGTGIGFCITGGASSTDNTSAATGVFVTVTYK
jgi:hypothetical protein